MTAAVACRTADVPRTHAGALGQVDRDDLALVGQPDLVDAVRGPDRVARVGEGDPADVSANSSAAIRCSQVASRMWLM